MATPKSIPEFIDDLEAADLEIVPGSAIWVPHPTKPDREIIAVMVREKASDK